MSHNDKLETDHRKIGERAEQVANWYFRLNGFLSIPGFVVHPDQVREYPRTEADLIAVRFPGSIEVINRSEMQDDKIITQLHGIGPNKKILFVLVEVKSGDCSMNGPWSERPRKNIQRVVRRLGFAEANKIDEISEALYSNARWSDEKYVLQYVCVGKNVNAELSRSYENLLQITYEEISNFLSLRFKMYPEKMPITGVIHEQWPDFGKKYGFWFYQNITLDSINDLTDIYAKSISAVNKYIETGKCQERIR